jgi:hypothetical protein
MKDAAAENPSRRSARGWRVALAALLLLVAARAALPVALGWLLESRATQSLGRLVRVADVDLELLAGAVALDAVAVGPIYEGESPPANLDRDSAHFRCERLELRWSWLSLLSREFRIEAATLLAPEILVVRNVDGELVPVLRPRGDAPDQEEQGEEEGTASEAAPDDDWPVLIDRLTIVDLGAYFLNLARPERRPFELDVAEFNLQDLAVHGHEITLGAVGLREPHLRVIRDVDLTPFVAAPPDAGDGAEPAASAAPPPDASPRRPYHLARVDLEGANFTLVTDDGGEIVVTIDLQASGATTRRDARFPVDLRIGLDDGSIELDGEIGLAPLAFEGRVVWSDLPLHSIDEATGGALPFQVASGASAGSLTVDAFVSDQEAAEPSRIDLAGRVDVGDLELTSEEAGFALAWEGLEIEADAIALRPGTQTPPRVELARVRIDAPRLDATLVDSTPAADAPQQSAAAGPAAGATPTLRVARLDLTEGRADLVDERVDPELRTELRDVRVSARGVRWPERDVASLDASARGPGSGRLDTRGTLQGGDGRIELDLEQLGLAPWSPYAERAAGYRLESGEASLKAVSQIDGDRVAVESELRLDGLDVAELDDGRFQKDFGVSLDLALALLRDPKGRITLPFDVAIERGESAVGLRRVFLGALRQALIGALSTPIKGLGLVVPSVSGKPSGKLQVLASEPGEVAIADTSQVASVAAALDARPGLRVVLRGQTGPADGPAIARRILTQTVAADGRLPSVSAGRSQRKRVRAAIEARSRGESAPLDPEDEALLERWVEAVEVPATRRDALGLARAEALRDALAGAGVAPDRIALDEPGGGDPGVAVELAVAEP